MDRRGRRTVRRRAVVPAAVAALTSSLLISGCGSGDNPYALPKYDPAAANVAQPAVAPSAPAVAATAPSPRRVATPPPSVKYAPADPWGQGAWVERGRVAAPTVTEQAVVTAVTTYMSLRVQLSNTWVVDERALMRVAEGQALTSAQERATAQKERARRSVGRFVVNASAVKIDGDTATVTGCDFDATSEVGSDGRILVPPVGGVLITMQLRRTGSAWRVTDWPASRVPTCDWRNR